MTEPAGAAGRSLPWSEEHRSAAGVGPAGTGAHAACRGAVSSAPADGAAALPALTGRRAGGRPASPRGQPLLAARRPTVAPAGRGEPRERAAAAGPSWPDAADPGRGRPKRVAQGARAPDAARGGRARGALASPPPAAAGPPTAGGPRPRQAPPDGRPNGYGDRTGVTVGELLRRPQMWGFVATTACVEFCRGALFIALLPAYLPQRMGLSIAGVGLVISGQYLADTLFKVPAGWLVDRFGPWRALLPFVSLAALAVYLLPHVRALGPFVVLGVLFGLGASANWPAVLAGSVHISGLRARASATSITFLAWLAGGGMGPVLISFLVGRDFRLPFAVLAAVITGAPAAAFLGLTGVLASPRDPPWALRAEEAGTRQTLRALLANLRRAGWLIPGMFVQMLALGMILPVLVPFARQVLHLTQPEYGLMLLAGGTVTVLCLVPVGRMVDRLGSKVPLVIGFLLAAAAVLLLVGGRGEGDLLWRVALLGLSYALILPAWNGLTVGKIAENRRGLLLGVFMAIEGVGIAVGPLIGGWLYVRGYHLPFQVTAGVLAAIALFYLLTPARRFLPRTEDGSAG